MTRFWAPLSLLLWGSSHAFQSVSTRSHSLCVTSKDAPVVVLYAAGGDDFATMRVRQRLEANARRMAEQERRAREAAARIAEESRRAEEALKRAARDATSTQKDGSVVEVAKVSASEASQWAKEMVEVRMWNQRLKKAAEERRQIVDQARLNAEVESNYKVSKYARAKWALEMVDARLKKQERKMYLGREQIMMLSLKASQAEKNRMLAEQASQIKTAQIERRKWAAARVSERIRLQSEKQAIIDQINFERGLAIAMQLRNGEASRRKASKEQERMAASAERARWAAARVAMRLQKEAQR